MTALSMVAAVIAWVGVMFVAFVVSRGALTHYRHVRRQQRRGGAR